MLWTSHPGGILKKCCQPNTTQFSATATNDESANYVPGPVYRCCQSYPPHALHALQRNRKLHPADCMKGGMYQPRTSKDLASYHPIKYSVLQQNNWPKAMRSLLVWRIPAINSTSHTSTRSTHMLRSSTVSLHEQLGQVSFSTVILFLWGIAGMG